MRVLFQEIGADTLASSSYRRFSMRIKMVGSLSRILLFADAYIRPYFRNGGESMRDMMKRKKQRIPMRESVAYPIIAGDTIFSNICMNNCCVCRYARSKAS